MKNKNRKRKAMSVQTHPSIKKSKLNNNDIQNTTDYDTFMTISLSCRTYEQQVLIDSGADICVFKQCPWENSLYLKQPIIDTTLKGISPHAIPIVEKGIYHGLDFLIAPDIPCNLLSVASLKRAGISYQFSNFQWIIGSKQPLIITESADGLFYVSISALLSCLESEFSHMVASTAVFSAEQRARAQQVRDLHFILLHPSDRSLSDALDVGTILGTRLTKRDVKTYRDICSPRAHIYGPCSFCLAGKVNCPSYRSSMNEPSYGVGRVVHVDIYPFSETTLGGSNYFLLCLDEYSTYLCAFPLKRKSTDDLIVALNALKSHYNSFNHNIYHIECDHESNLL
jgi:hypothetical protein